MENPDANSGEEPKAKKTDSKPKKKASKKVKDELLVKNSIDINPKLEEAPNKTVVLGWGRMNPITVGHEKLVNKIKSVAKQEGATPLIYVSHSQDAKKNPLDYDDKIMLAKKAFGNIIVKSNSRTIIQIMQELQKNFSKVILVVGQDRIKQFDDLLNKYNGKDYNFDSINIVSAGDRDPDSEGVSGMSASKMRAAASQGDFKKFKTGLPRRLQSDAQDVYDMVSGGMKNAEMMEQLDEALTIQQRRMRAITMRKFKSKIAQGRRRMAKKAATMDKLKVRARKAAIKIIRKKVAGKKGENYAALSPSEKMLIDKRVAKKKSAIDRIAKKLLPAVRKADLAKLSGKKVNEEFESYLINEEFSNLFEEPTVGQDKDIADRKGTQPAVYHKGLAKSTKVKRDAHFKKGAKMDDDNPAAYEPAPGDAEAETKPSKHTKRYHQMFNKEGKVKLDRRFRAFRVRKEEALDEITINTDAEKRLKRQHKDERQNLAKEHEREMDGLLTRELRKKITQVNKEEFKSDKDLIAFIEEATNDVYDQVMLDEEKGNEGLKKKAEKSGMPLSILKKVYDRGIAAWRTGHRPGTTPQQWGFARVNSFITKSSGTWGKADADLAAKVRKEEVDLEEKLSVSDGLGAWIDDFKKSDAPQFAGKSDKKKQQMAVAAFVDAGGKLEEGAVSPAQRAAIAISKKAKAGKPGYDSEGKSLKEDDPCWDSHEQRGMKKKNGKLVPNCVPKNEGADEECSPEDLMFEEFVSERNTVDAIKAKIGSISNKKNYEHAKKTLIALLDRKAKESKGKMRHSIEYYAAQIAKSYQGVDARTLAKMIPENYIFEVGGAGDRGTEKVTKRYKKDTPGETVSESVDDLFEEHFKEEVTQKQLNDLERFADRLLDKFGIDVEFTKHFADRMNDDRNKPAI